MYSLNSRYTLNSCVLNIELFAVDLFVCGPCSVEKDLPCSNPTVNTFYKNRDRLDQAQVEDFKNQALESRILQSLRKEEHLQFSGRGETSLLKMIRFKLGVCEKEAVKLLEKLISDRVVHLGADNTVHVHQEVIHKITGRNLTRKKFKKNSRWKPFFIILKKIYFLIFICLFIL